MVKKAISLVYNSFVRRRNKSFDNHLEPIEQMKAKVISIGNISAGGTGKTPLCEALAQYLLSQNQSVAIAAKGYKGEFSGTLLVRDEAKIFANVRESGDEMAMLARKLSIPIAVNKHKYLAAKFLDDTFHPDYILLDDGFQHRKLHRDLDIVIIDRQSIENPNTFPLGRLREPIENLKRADVICAYEDVLNDEILLKNLQNQTAISKDEIIGLSTQVLDLLSWQNTLMDRSNRSLLVSGIGNNAKFHKTSKEFGVDFVGSINYKDHIAYSEREVAKIIETAQKSKAIQVITTEKDLVKLQHFINSFNEAEIELGYIKIKTTILNSKNNLFQIIKNLI